MLQKLKDKIIRKLGGYTLEDVSRTEHITACEAPVQELKVGCSVRINAGCSVRIMEDRCRDAIAVTQRDMIIKHAKETLAYEIGKQLMDCGSIKYHMLDNKFDNTRRELIGILHYVDIDNPAASIAYGEKV